MANSGCLLTARISHLIDLDQVRVRLLVDILRNEKPVYWNPQSAIFFVNGNAGSGSPEGNGKLVKYQATILGNRDSTGVGVKTVSF